MPAQIQQGNQTNFHATFFEHAFPSWILTGNACPESKFNKPRLSNNYSEATQTLINIANLVQVSDIVLLFTRLTLNIMGLIDGCRSGLFIADFKKIFALRDFRSTWPVLRGGEQLINLKRVFDAMFSGHQINQLKCYSRAIRVFKGTRPQSIAWLNFSI